jgi:hypothetical protein
MFYTNIISMFSLQPLTLITKTKIPLHSFGGLLMVSQKVFVSGKSYKRIHAYIEGVGSLDSALAPDCNAFS